MAEENQPAEITIETFTGEEAPAVDALSDEQKTFLNEHKEELDDEVADKYGIDKSAAPYIPEAPAAPEKKETKPKEEETDDDDLEEEDQKKIGKLVRKEMEPVNKELKEARTITAVDAFIRETAEKIPSAAKYRDAMLTTSKIPGYENLKPQELFRICAGDELMRIGAAKERAASKRATATQVQNSGGRPAGGGKKDYNSMTKEEFAAEKARVLGRQGV